VALTGVLANCGSDGPAASDRQRSRERPQLGPTARSAAIACGARSAACPDGRSARYLWLSEGLAVVAAVAHAFYENSPASMSAESSLIF
jgi:hypothetical protein